MSAQLRPAADVGTLLSEESGTREEMGTGNGDEGVSHGLGLTTVCLRTPGLLALASLRPSAS